MAFLVLLVLDNPDQGATLIDAWKAAGAKGITIIESSGLGRASQAGMRDDLPLMPSLRDVFRGKERHNLTLFSAVETQETVDALVDAAHRVVGDLSQPETGLLFVANLQQAYGLNKVFNTKKET